MLWIVLQESTLSQQLPLKIFQNKTIKWKRNFMKKNCYQQINSTFNHSIYRPNSATSPWKASVCPCFCIRNCFSERSWIMRVLYLFWVRGSSRMKIPYFLTYFLLENSCRVRTFLQILKAQWNNFVACSARALVFNKLDTEGTHNNKTLIQTSSTCSYYTWSTARIENQLYLKNGMRGP